MTRDEYRKKRLTAIENALIASEDSGDVRVGAAAVLDALDAMANDGPQYSERILNIEEYLCRIELDVKMVRNLLTKMHAGNQHTIGMS